VLICQERRILGKKMDGDKFFPVKQGKIALKITDF
jgi:hypothetical protein